MPGRDAATMREGARAVSGIYLTFLAGDRYVETEGKFGIVTPSIDMWGKSMGGRVSGGFVWVVFGGVDTFVPR